MFHFPRFQFNFDNSLPCMTLCNPNYTPVVEWSAACRKEAPCFCNQQTGAGSKRFSVMFNMYRIRKQQFLNSMRPALHGEKQKLARLLIKCF